MKKKPKTQTNPNHMRAKKKVIQVAPPVILFTQKESIYNSLDVETWDKEKNAMLFVGSNPIIAHPPCRSWGRLKAFAKPVPGEQQFAIHSINLARSNGGIVEHPAYSTLWARLNLPTGSQVDEHGGYTIDIDQFWYGHKARKKTWLYICKIPKNRLPLIPLSFDCVMHKVGGSRKSTMYKYPLKEVSKKEREATPVQLAKWLIEACKYVEK